MRLLHLALAVMVALVAVSNGMTVSANEISAPEEERGRRGADVRKFKKKCNRFTNWFIRIFNKTVKEC
jgi:hypothetical protein